MATTVIEAFNKFVAEHVNLRDDETKIARASRDWLVGQICNFPSKVDHFPQLYTEKIFSLAHLLEIQRRGLLMTLTS